MCTASFVSLIADALLHDKGIMWLDLSYGDGGEKDSVQSNKQATVASYTTKFKPWTVHESGP